VPEELLYSVNGFTGFERASSATMPERVRGEVLDTGLLPDSGDHAARLVSVKRRTF
jgi:hypothetical protein